LRPCGPSVQRLVVPVKLEHVAEDAVLITFGDDIDETLPPAIAAVVDRLSEAELPWLVDLVPSYTTLLVVYDPVGTDFRQAECYLRQAIQTALSSDPDSTTAAPSRTVELPVYYSPETGPDLEQLAGYARTTVDRLIQTHTETRYTVYALGFAPGFAFMGQVDPSIACPRKSSPRKRVPAGSVGIAGRQTAVYPTASPGGWQLIGRCPVSLFNTRNLSLLQVGDQVAFRAIGREEFLALGGTL